MAPVHLQCFQWFPIRGRGLCVDHRSGFSQTRILPPLGVSRTRRWPCWGLPISRVLGVKFRLALASGACFALLPVTVQQLPTTKVDAAYAGAVIAMIALAVHIIGEFQRFRLEWCFAGPMGCVMGLVLGSKLSARYWPYSVGYGFAGLFLLVTVCPVRFRSVLALQVPIELRAGGSWLRALPFWH